MADDRTVLATIKALAPGYELAWYTIKQVLGQGGFGITYLGYDNNLAREVAIKEYLPASFAYRQQDFSVKPLTGEHRDHYNWGLESFLNEAKTLAKFNHDNIVRVHAVFEQNSTAYMVMEYEHGDSLAALLKQRGTVDQAFQEAVFFPIFDGLEKIHELGFIHRDIKPSNIYIRGNNTPVLIDFGSAREASLQQSGEITSLVSQGYTPLEQYSSSYGQQGPWTDIYSLAATMYQGITGKLPDDAVSRSAKRFRSQPDDITQLAAARFPGYEQRFLDAVFAGLALEPELRAADLSQWKQAFNHGNETIPTIDDVGNDATRLHPSGFASPTQATNHQEQLTAPITDFPPPIQPAPAVEKSPRNRGLLFAGIAGAVLLAAGASGYIAMQAANTPAPVSVPEPAQVAVPDIKASEESTRNNADVMDNTNAPTVTQPEVPTPAPEENTRIVYDLPLTTDLQSDAPRSIKQLSQSSPIFPPVEGLPDEYWKEQDCSNCHEWSQANLCKQGNFYVSNEDTALDRIAHPYGGFFKRALKLWAQSDCQ